MRRLLLVLALGGCDVVFHIDRIGPSTGTGDSGTPSDAHADASPCAGVAVGLYGTAAGGLVQVCVTSSEAVHLSGLIDTDATCAIAIPQATGPTLCAVTGATIDTTANVRVVGARALVLAATGAITVGNTIDLSGNPIEPGAAGDTPSCDAQAGTGSSNGGGGGGGGSFQTAGGAGGSGDGGGGHAASPGAVTHVRGGCRGGLGGGGGIGSGGAQGHAGGAIYLASATKIVVSGGIDASGGGGGLGTASAAGSSGGGGGASGGLVAFDTPELDASVGLIWANGGGGGGGGGGAGSASSDGVAGYPSTGPAVPGAGGGGGDGTPLGGDGGAGAIAIAVGSPGRSAVPRAGGGGGGGGQGFILFYGTAAATGVQNISPPLTRM